MTPHAWIVGQNEGAILGEGWYGRCPDWFGLPYRESFGRATLRIPNLGTGDRLVFLLSSCLALHRDRQSVRIRVGEETWNHTLDRPDTGQPWRTVSVQIRNGAGSETMTEVLLEPEEWRHGRYEPVQDFREVGLLFAGIFKVPR